MNRFLHLLFALLFALFCFAYPIAVTGVAFDVHPPFSLAWAGSALLLLEGSLLIVAAMLLYGWRRGSCAGLIVMALSYVVEAIGVQTAFPFGTYHYTDILSPRLPASVPLAVLFAWVLIVFGVYGWVRLEKYKLNIRRVLLGALLATLLDLEIEPVAAHLEHYWEWVAPGRLNYYGVPLMNFVAWFVVACLLLVVIDSIFPKMTEYSSRLVQSAPRLLFGASLFMFGLVDLTHGYYGSVVFGALGAVMVYLLIARVKVGGVL
jgi:putative membrane protein